MRRVLVLETQLKHYRKPLFEQLAARLAARGVALQVAYSPPTGEDRARADTVPLPGIGVEVRSRELFGWVLQDAWALARSADLVILEQSNRLALNLALIAVGGPALAFWGHGFNHQALGWSASEIVKRALLTRVDWWFAYTPGIARYLVEHGVRAETISTVYNTVELDELSARRIDGPVGIYCGALVADKQLAFLVDAAAEIRRLVPAFELLIVGDGPERPMLEAIARVRPYIRVVGPAFGAERAPYFSRAAVALVPARVGLAVNDAFGAGIPLVTTDAPGHGPELEYLTPGTGIVAPHDVDAYAAAVAGLLTDRERLTAMQEAASVRARELPLSRMVEAFVDGIMRCLG